MSFIANIGDVDSDIVGKCFEDHHSGGDPAIKTAVPIQTYLNQEYGFVRDARKFIPQQIKEFSDIYGDKIHEVLGNGDCGTTAFAGGLLYLMDNNPSKSDLLLKLALELKEKEGLSPQLDQDISQVVQSMANTEQGGYENLLQNSDFILSMSRVIRGIDCENAPKVMERHLETFAVPEMERNVYMENWIPTNPTEQISIEGFLPLSKIFGVTVHVKCLQERSEFQDNPVRQYPMEDNNVADIVILRKNAHFLLLVSDKERQLRYGLSSSEETEDKDIFYDACEYQPEVGVDALEYSNISNEELDSEDHFFDVLGYKPVKINSSNFQKVAPSKLDYLSMIIKTYWIKFINTITPRSIQYAKHGISLPHEPPERVENPHLYSQCTASIHNLIKKGSQTGSSVLNTYIDCLKADFSSLLKTTEFATDQVSIPIHGNYTNCGLNEVVDSLNKNPASEKIILPLVLSKRDRSKNQEHGLHIVLVIIDKNNKSIYYYDPQGFPVDHPENKIGRSDSSYHLKNLINKISEKFDISSNQVFVNERRHQSDIHNCGIHVASLIENYIKEGSFQDALNNVRHKNIENTRTELAQRINDYRTTLIPMYDRIAGPILNESGLDIRSLLGSTAPLTQEKIALIHQFIQTGTADVLSKIKNQDISLNQLLMAVIPYITEVQIDGVDADNMTLYQTRAMSLLTALFDHRQTDPSLWDYVRNKLFEHAS